MMTGGFLLKAARDGNLRDCCPMRNRRDLLDDNIDLLCDDDAEKWYRH